METRLEKDNNNLLGSLDISLISFEIIKDKEPKLILIDDSADLIGVNINVSDEERYKHFISLINPENASKVDEFLKTAIDTGKLDISFRYAHPSKGIVTYYLKLKIDDSKSKGVCLSGYLQDISNLLFDINKDYSNYEIYQHCSYILRYLPKYEDAIQSLLKLLTVFYQADRTHLFLISKDGMFVNDEFEYVKEGGTSTTALFNNIPVSYFYQKIFSENNFAPILIENTDNIKRSNDEFARMLKDLRLKSNLSYPIKYDGAIKGFIGIDNPKNGLDNFEPIKSISIFITQKLIQKANVAPFVKYEETLPNVLFDLPIIIYIKNASTGQYLMVSKLMLDFLGFNDLSQMIGCTDFEIFDEKTARNITLGDRYALSSDKPYVFNESFKDKNGNIRYFQTTKFKTIDALSRMNIFSISIDVTETHKVFKSNEKSLATEIEKANSLNLEKSYFIYNMSHDIKTPLNTIKGCVDHALRHSTDTETTKKALDRINLSSNYLLSILDSIDEMTKLETKQTIVTTKVNNLYDSITSLVDVFETQFKDKRISFEVDTEEIRGMYVHFDDLKVKRILSNLLSNSLKYTKKGGNVSLKVGYSQTKTSHKADFSFIVKDDGVGIDKAFLSKIFERFEKDKNSLQDENSGIGLGLAIVRSLVDLLDGNIILDSEVNKGTTVMVTIPLRIANNEEIESYMLSSKEEEFDVVLDENTRVLVVEDNDLNREILVEMLIELGVKVESAIHGENALKMIADKGIEYYQIIFMDIQMPVMDGLTAAKRLRKKYSDVEIPIVGVSANTFSEDKKIAFENGMNDYVTKPVSLSELRSAIIRNVYAKK